MISWSRDQLRDPNLRKFGYNRRTKFYHKIRWNGGFYTAHCESGTRIELFEELEDARENRLPCKKCFPKGEPVMPENDWDGPWFIASAGENLMKQEVAYVCRKRFLGTSVQFGPFTMPTAEQLLSYLLNPENEE